MRRLNRDAARAAAHAGVRCATDITGFGLLGHARNLAIGSRCGVEIDAASLPVLPGVAQLVDAGWVPGGSRRNLAFAEEWAQWDPALSPLQRVVATDAQTSGGLLIAVSPAQCDELMREIRSGGGVAEQVGRLVDDVAGTVRVRAA
jgi:selenide,water dikinase